MPLSTPEPREPYHVRTIECRGFRRADGLWDIEGRMVDVKTYLFENPVRGRVEPGTHLHDMTVRLTVDEDLMVHAAEACTDASPFRICPEAAPRMSALKGMRIAGGWNVAVRRLLGGAAGCTHLVELLGPIATTAWQTISAVRRARDDMTSASGERPKKIDSCYAYAADSEVIAQRWPQFYTGPDRG